MRGMNRTTGKSIEGIAYLTQRLNGVLTTPKYSRVMQREYGCGLFELIDGNMNSSWLVQAYAHVAEAINNPVNGLGDFALERITPLDVSESDAMFELSGIYSPTGENIKIATGQIV